MADSSSVAKACSLCGETLPNGSTMCPECKVSVDWLDLIEAGRFAQTRFEKWEASRAISRDQLTAITRVHGGQSESMLLAAQRGAPIPSQTGLPSRGVCWSCKLAIEPDSEFCPACGAPIDDPLVHQLRCWYYTGAIVKAYSDSRLIPLAQAHGLIHDVKGSIGALQAILETKRQPVVATCVEDETPEAPVDVAPKLSDRPRQVRLAPPRLPRRPFWDVLLDPRSIQWLLGLGGALLVIGLVIWLATLGIFKNPLVVAFALGIANGVVLGLGLAVTLFTRFQTAGRALALLACLVMPLNLWFYHSNDLLTLEGHLWLAALVCCLLYAASALVLRDSMFVYVLSGGVAMTGLLMLADVGRFWEIASPAAFLVAIGMICLHVERAFPEMEGPFSRKSFGMAFFWSGHALLGGGLLLLLGAQIAGDWLYEPFFKQFYDHFEAGPPEIITERWAQLLALALVVAGGYAYLYSDVVVRRVGVYIYFAVFCLLWAEVLVINLFALSITTEIAIAALAATALLANLSPAGFQEWSKNLPPGEKAEALATSLRPMARAAVPLGLFLSTAPVLLGVLLYLRATYEPLRAAWLTRRGGEPYEIGWFYVAAMLLAVISCRVGAFLYRRSAPWLSTTYFFGTAAGTLACLAGLLSVLGVKTWDNVAPIVMILPIVYILSARFYRGHSPEKPLAWCAQAATAVILVSVLAASMHLTPKHVFEPATGVRLNLMLAIVFFEAAVFYALAAAFRKQGLNIYLCTAAACGAVWQLLQYQQVEAEYYTLTFAVVGWLLLVGYRLALLERTGIVEPAFQCANALMSVSFVAAALIALSRFAAHRGEVHWSLVWLLGGLAVLSLLAAWLVRHPAWRRWYVVMTIAEAGLMFLAIHVLSHLTVWQKLEIFSIVIGAALLTIGHVGMHREQHEQHDDLVSFSLSFGSVLLAVPLGFAVLYHRFAMHFSTLDELGALVAGILLLGSGFMLQIRSTTLAGITLLMGYLVTMLLYLNMLENVQTAAIWMTIGGATVFTIGLLLSIYRDRLLTLPDRIQRREGIFRVLGWR